MTDEAIGASFRDPGGYVFERDGVLLRRVLPPALADYELLMSSGLYDITRIVILAADHNA